MAEAAHWHLWADEAGESHLERQEVPMQSMQYAPPAPPFDVSTPVPVAQFVRIRAFPREDKNAPWRNVPKRHYAVVLSGAAELIASDGTRAILRKGDYILSEDTTGKGHRTIVQDGEPWEALFIELPEQGDG